jgi:hypothetical protein
MKHKQHITTIQIKFKPKLIHDGACAVLLHVYNTQNLIMGSHLKKFKCHFSYQMCTIPSKRS